MGYAKTSASKRSASSPSLLRRFSLQSSRSFLSRRLSSRSSTSDLEENPGPQFLPLIRVVSPFTLPSISEQLLLPPQQPPQQDQRDQPSAHRRSTSWSEVVAIFTRRSAVDDAVINSNDHIAKRKPKFTLESPSDLDLSRMSSAAASPIPSTSSLPASAPHARPHLVRRDAKGNPTRRYTFAMAMTDEEITDEVLVEELERMRAVRSWTGGSTNGDLEDFWDIGGSSSSQSPNDEPHFFDSPAREDESDFMGITMSTRSTHLRSIGANDSLPSFPLHHRLSDASSVSPTSPSGPSFNTSSAPTSARTSLLDSSDASWHTARRILLTCRECVRTERHYLSGMQTLLSQETHTPPPPLMLSHAESLVEMSERLLVRMEENPNVWGVVSAFLSEEAGLEEGFVGWCTVVGKWFEGNMAEEDTREQKGKWKESLLFPQQLGSPSKTKGDESPRATLKRTMSGWRRSAPVFRTPIEPLPTTSSGSSTSSTGSSLASTSMAATSVASTPHSSLPPSPPNGKRATTPGGVSPSGNAARSTRKPAVRELAILPTQRVMRYVLLFRDLLAHTPPTSPSRALVERAVEAAVRIADKCDRAQAHTAFGQSPAKASNSHGYGEAPTMQRSWATRRLSLNKPRDMDYRSHGKAVSENGHSSGATMEVAATQDTISPVASRPASTRSQGPARNVLVKPRRSSSTSAVADVVAAPSPTRKARDHTNNCPNRLTKTKGRTQSTAPPPSSFASMGRREILSPVL